MCPIVGVNRVKSLNDNKEHLTEEIDLISNVFNYRKSFFLFWDGKSINK
jgi:hypothetical protein